MKLINETQKTSYDPYSGKFSNGDCYNIFDIARVNGATHKNGSLKTDIYLATIRNDNSNTKNYIGFELPYSEPLTPEYFNAIAENYLAKEGSDLCTYVGVLKKTEEDSVKLVFNSKVSKKFLDQYTQYLVDHPPKLPPEFTNCNESIDEYSGIDHNGKAFKIVDVDKICKDANNTYLYTSNYIDSNKKHFAIAFETDARLQDIVKYKEEHEINGITKLLTISADNLSSHSLNYVGRFVYNGDITRNIRHSSKALMHTLKKLQKEY